MKHKLSVKFHLKVADVAVMLALMAGRNAGEGVTLVKEGGVRQKSSPYPITSRLIKVITPPPLSGPTSTLPPSSSSGPS